MEDPFERLASRAFMKMLPISAGILLIVGICFGLFYVPVMIISAGLHLVHTWWPVIPARISDASGALVGAWAWGIVGGAFVLWHAARHWRDGSPEVTGPPAGPRGPITHGSAEWGRTERLHTEHGLILGRQPLPFGVPLPKPKRGQSAPVQSLLRLDGEGHVLTLGATGSGKGVCAVIPNLLAYPGSVVVTDPKGENTLVTARARRAMGQRVVILDPFQIAGGTDGYNPLATLDPYGLDAYEEAAQLAELLVMRESGQQKDPFWENEAKALLTGLMLFVAAHEEQKNLGRVLELKALPTREFQTLLEQMQASHAADGGVARTANDFLKKADRERSGVLSQLSSELHFLESPRVRAVLSASTFDFAALKAAPTSVFLVLPTERLDVQRRWLRLMVGCAARAMMAAPGAPATRVLFLLDEFPNLGYLGPIEQAVTLVRGYGARFWFLTQDLPRLKAVYPTAWETFVSQSSALQAFGVNDLFTAKYLSELAGHATVAVTTRQDGGGSSRAMGEIFGTTHQRDGTTVGQAGRPLLFPDEVRRLSPAQELLIIGGHNAMLVDRVNYLRDPEFAGRFDANAGYENPKPVLVAAPPAHRGLAALFSRGADTMLHFFGDV